MDGLDIACCTFEVEGDNYRFSLDYGETIPFDDKWRSRLLHLWEQSAETYAKTHVYLGHWMGEQIQAFVQRHGLKPDFVAVHGQTIFHQPEKNFTAQIGDGETLATYLTCPLVTNFRNKDIALGGEGAPLIPIGEHYLFPDYRLFLNLGGIANVTFGSRAFDVCACNLVLNEVYRRAWPEGPGYDDHGRQAAGGTLIPELLAALDALPYFRQPPPKSLGWEWVTQAVLPLLDMFPADPADQLHTFVHHVAGQIAQALRLLAAPPGPLLITGGGRHHTFLLEQIRTAIAPMGITVDEATPTAWVDYKEAIVFAFLGLRTLTGRTTTLASATGARQDAVTGSIHLPPDGGWQVLSRAWSSV
jgi:anhydro-N-acetylmuramic acid kinase